MKEIVLATSRNSIFRDLFIRGGFTVREADPSSPAAYMQGSLIVYELQETGNPLPAELIRHNRESRIVCLRGSSVILDHTALCRAGIWDLLEDPSPQALFTYVETIISGSTGGGYGRILLLDDDPVVSAVIKGISSSMGYRVEVLSSIQTLLESMVKPAVQFVIVNIGMNKLNIRELINSFSARNDIRSLPVIVYKDMSKGIFIHEIVSGLNRLTRSIVSAEELYGFLAANLFKKRFMPAFFSLGAQVEADSNICYAKDTISRIIFSGGCSLFEGDSIFANHSPWEMMEQLQGMNSLLVAVSGLKWLIREKKTGHVTCGGGVLC